MDFLKKCYGMRRLCQRLTYSSLVVFASLSICAQSKNEISTLSYTDKIALSIWEGNKEKLLTTDPIKHRYTSFSDPTGKYGSRIGQFLIRRLGRVVEETGNEEVEHFLLDYINWMIESNIRNGREVDVLVSSDLLSRLPPTEEKIRIYFKLMTKVNCEGLLAENPNFSSLPSWSWAGRLINNLNYELRMALRNYDAQTLYNYNVETTLNYCKYYVEVVNYWDAELRKMQNEGQIVLRSKEDFYNRKSR